MSGRVLLAGLFAMLASALLGYAYRDWTTFKSDVQNTASDELTPVAFLELAVTVGSSDPPRADLLAQAAVDRLAREPEGLPDFWAGFEKYRKSRHALAPEELLARLLIIEDATEAAIGSCRTKGQLDIAWRVHERIEQAIQIARDAVFAGVVADVERFKDSKIRSPSEWLAQFAALRPNWERRLSGALATPPTANQEQSLHALASAAASWQSEVLVSVHEVEIELDQSLNAAATSQAQPAEKGTDGKLQMKLDQLDTLAQALEPGDLEGWQTFLTSSLGGAANVDREKPADESAIKQIADAAARIAALQQLRYNLWALNQLTIAETSDAWDGYVGGVEVGVLRPATSALYSMVYDTRIREVSDPKAQADTVQRILRHEKQTLKSF